MKKYFTLIVIFTIAISVNSQTWVQKNNFPSPVRFNGTTFKIGNNVYAGMGRNNSWQAMSDLYKYNPLNDSWTSITPFGGPASSGAIALTFGSKAIVGLGWTGSSVLKDLYEFDALNGSWTSKTTYPGNGGRNSVAGVCNGRGYIFGGTGSSGSVTNDLWEYNPTLNSWASIPNVPISARTNTMCFVIDSLIYFGFGHNGSGTDYKDVWSFSPSTGIWNQLPIFPGIERLEAVAIVVNGNVVIGGGQRVGTATKLDDYYSYNSSTNQWSPIQGFANGKRAFAFSFSIGTKGYLIGGRDSSNLGMSDVWEVSNISTSNKVSRKSNHQIVNLFPNPASNILNINISDENQQGNFSIFDQSGKKVITYLPKNGINQIDISSLGSGVYYYLLNSDNQNIDGKFLVR
jgi:N-acetylneuraminic acid mutarotase